MKKQSVKFLAIVLCISMLLPMVFTSIASGAELATPTVTVGTATTCAGGKFTVDVTASGNPGISAFTFDIEYDSMNIVLDTVEINPVIGGQTSKYNNRIVWLASQDVAFNGKLFTLSFTVKDDTPSGDYDITVSYTKGDICNHYEQDVDFTIVPGKVSVMDVIPGDINDDLQVNNKDLIRLMRYIAGEDVYVVSQCIDVNGDNAVNNKDLVRLMRFLAGEDVTIYPLVVVCRHEMVPTAAKAPSCTEDGNIAYWYCNKCDKYFSDENGKSAIDFSDTTIAAKGHTEVEIPRVEPNYEEGGYTEGVKCSVCDKIIVEPIWIPPLQKEEYSIIYNIYNGDTYLMEKGVVNNNPQVYTKQDGLKLNPLNAEGSEGYIEGYKFEGWYDMFGNPVSEIAKGTTGQVTLYARWTKTQYKVTYDSNIISVPTAYRTVDETTPLEPLSWDPYIFMGWSDSEGEIITSVKPGTTNITVHANWTSQRNQARPNNYKATGPIFIEQDNQYLFVYDIGSIYNVPLYTVTDYGYQTGFTWSETITEKESQEVGTNSKTVEAVANATTSSSSWTLSKDWNELITDEKGGEHKKSSDYTHVVSTGTSSSSSESGSENNSTFHQDTNKNGTSAKTHTDNSWNVNAEVGVKYGILNAKVGGGYSSQTEKDNENYNDNFTDDTSTWNKTTSYANATTSSRNSSTSSSISDSTSETWNHSIAKSTGGSDSTTSYLSDSTTVTNEIESALHSVTTVDKTVSRTVTNASAPYGYYRTVCAGTVHCYAVVGYDIATKNYFTYDYSVLDDETYFFFDYSKNDPTYSDYSNAVLPFEVPIEVHDYVVDALRWSKDLIIDRDTGIVTEYIGDKTEISIPDYASFDNGDGTYEVVKVVGIDKDAFRYNENSAKIESIRLGKYITDIEEYTFAGMSALKSISYNELHKIGACAFASCTSLEEFTVGNTVSELGEGAFAGVNKLTVNAGNSSVAYFATVSGANSLTLNIADISDELSDITLAIPSTERFELFAGGKTLDNVNIVSDAKEVSLNRVTFANNTKTALTLDCEKLTLNQVNIQDAPGFAMILKAENTDTALQGRNCITSAKGKAILSKTINLAMKEGISETSYINIGDGNIYVCGTVTGTKYLNVASTDNIIYIAEEEYNRFLTSYTVSFDANGGECEEASREVPAGDAIGELPEPTREGFSFVGWYDENGNEVTADDVFEGGSNINLRAYWLSGWVKETDVPEGAQTLNPKWKYDLTSYTTSPTKTLESEGWTNYKTERTSWGSEQTTYSNPDNGVRNVWTTQETIPSGTEHHWVYYHRYGNNSYGHDGTASSWERHQIDLTNPLTYRKDYVGKAEYIGYAHDGDAYALWFLDYEYDKTLYSTITLYHYQEPVYTYYYSKVESKEIDSDPTGQDNVSNVVKYVQYIAK